MAIFTVTIVDYEDKSCNPWVSCFSSREKAEAFQTNAQELLKRYAADDHTGVSLDQADMDDDGYISWIGARYDYEGVDD